MGSEDQDYDYDDAFGTPCPHCNGDGEVNCHCGGDLCLCENHGDAPCPVCFGEGEVSEATYDRYEEGRRKHVAALRAALSQGGGE
jgi:RecJ-like exonuclease